MCSSSSRCYRHFTGLRIPGQGVRHSNEIRSETYFCPRTIVFHLYFGEVPLKFCTQLPGLGGRVPVAARQKRDCCFLPTWGLCHLISLNGFRLSVSARALALPKQSAYLALKSLSRVNHSAIMSVVIPFLRVSSSVRTRSPAVFYSSNAISLL